MTVCHRRTGRRGGLAAAVRSTWSPCGLSMLSTITPLGERAKGHSYRSTAGVVRRSAPSSGAPTLGAAMGLSGRRRALRSTVGDGDRAVRLRWPPLVAAVSDTGVAGVRLPIHHRQVNERWLDQYRPWVYGAGFGWQIGTGLVTYITTAAVYLMVVLGALTADPAVAFGLGVAFGALRGLAVLLTRQADRPRPAPLVPPPVRRRRGPVVGRVGDRRRVRGHRRVVAAVLAVVRGLAGGLGRPGRRLGSAVGRAAGRRQA